MFPFPSVNFFENSTLVRDFFTPIGQRGIYKDLTCVIVVGLTVHLGVVTDGVKFDRMLTDRRAKWAN